MRVPLEIIYDFSRNGKTIFVTTHYMTRRALRRMHSSSRERSALDSPSALKAALPSRLVAPG